MSQTTRCPSCATAFRVVADQLRISDGWVRCGHCKEIFDATAYLQEAPEQALLPEMPLDSLNAPPPVAFPEELARGRGGARSVPAVDAAHYVSAPFLDDEPVLRPGPDRAPSSAAALLTLDVPEPGLPTFLVAQDATDHSAQNSAAPVQATPFIWGSAADPAMGTTEPVAADGGFVGEEGGNAAPSGNPSHADQPLAPAGYELPSAPLPEDDFEWLPEYAEPEPEPEPAEAVPSHSPEVSSPPVVAMDALDDADAKALPAQRQDVSGVGGTADIQVPAAALDFSAVLAQQDTENTTEQRAEDSTLDAADEPSFVRTARRKAFWRQPAVRAVLVLLSFLLGAVLLLQVVLSQRNYLAAAQPQWLPFLKTLCVPLQCKVTPYRQISSVVVDSSSFNKVQGDTYQFALALKNTSDNVLEMPAIELTLTDAQDQPVLRRVLTRQDLSAPRTLAARGDWSTVLQIQLAVDGARIAGYRVLAFYP